MAGDAALDEVRKADAASGRKPAPRTEPPPEERRFADEELAAMKARLAQIVKAKVLVDVGVGL